jgi:hypothetical protein
MDDTDRRLDAVEESIKELFREAKAVAITQAGTNKTLERLDLTLLELKEAVRGLQARPGGWWDKIVGAIITALVAGGVAALVGVVAK